MSVEDESSTVILLRQSLADGFTLNSDGCDGRRVIRGTDLRLALNLSRNDDNADPSGLRMSDIDIEGKVDLRYLRTRVAVSAWNCRFLGGLALDEAHIPSLILNNCELIGDAGDPPLTGYGFRSDGSVWLYKSSFRTEEDRVPAIQFSGAIVDGALDLSACFLSSATGPALMAERLTVNGPIYLRTGSQGESFSAIGAGQNGVIRLFNAHVSSEVTCTVTSRDSSVEIKNTTGGPAISAQGLRTGGDLTLGGTFAGSGPNGTIRLLESQVGGDVVLDRLIAENANGPVVNAERMNVDGALIVAGRSMIAGAREDGAFRLFKATIASGCRFRDILIRNSSGPAVDGRIMRIGAELDLNASTFQGSTALSVLRFEGAAIAGTVYCSNASVQSDWSESQKKNKGEDERAEWGVDGMTFSGVRVASKRAEDWKQWLTVLRWQTPYHAAQPYFELASLYRARGDDSAVRSILIAERNARAARTHSSAIQHSWTTMTKVLLGYGYKPWRALFWLFGVLALSVVLAVSLGGVALQATPAGLQGVVAVAQNPVQPPAPCALFDRVSYGLDLGTPFLATKGRDRCQLTSTTQGRALGGTSWVLQVMSWGLAALFVAGFTSVVRKT